MARWLRSALLLGLVLLVPLLASNRVFAGTYSSASIPIAWIDPISGGHTRVGYNTSPYFFSNVGGCGTTQPVLDDTLSNEVNIGFTFWFAGVAYTTLRISTNGRLQFGNTSCGYGTGNIGPPQTYPYVYPDGNMNRTMKVFGADLDPTDLVDRANYPTAGAQTNCKRSGTGANSCGIYVQTIGSEPYRSFVVTWYNVPEWVNFSNTSGSFTMQAILQENGEFIYQYLTLNHGGTGEAEVGWQVDNQDYDVLQFANGTEPDNNTAIKFYVPQPVAEYRMEQPTWGGGNPVLDTSGNGRHAGLVTAGGGSLPYTTASSKVCRGGVIPSNSSAADISALVTPFSMQTVGSQGTITFWYKQPDNSTNRMLLDASYVVNTAGASRWFYVMKTSNRQLKFVLYDQAGTRFEATTANNSMSSSGNWDHIGLSWNLNGKPGTGQDRILLWINGTLLTTQTFTTSQPIATALTTLYIGDNRSTSGVEDSSGNPAANGSRGTGNSAASIIDEVRIYNFEGGKGLIDRDRNQASGCLAHYAISHAGSGTTCQPSQVVVTAHDSNHNRLLMPNNTTTIQLRTSTNRGDWSVINGYGTLNNGMADDGYATYLFNGEYQVVLGLSHTTSAVVNMNVTDGQLVESATEDPDLIITACSGISGFNACDTIPLPRCVPPSPSNPTGTNYGRLKTKLAGDGFSLDLVAIKSDGTLEPAFNGRVNIDLVANTLPGVAIDPTTYCPTSQTAVIPIATNVAFGSSASPADTAGYGKVTVAASQFTSTAPNYQAYRDVRVRFTCSATYCPPLGMQRCSSDNFAIRPKDVSITAVAPLTTNTNSYAGTSGYKQVAGSDFSLQATAVPGYSGTLAFDRPTPADSSLVTSCYGASSGCANPLPTIALRNASGLSNVTFNTASANTGSTGASVFQYHEVGTFKLAAGAVYDKNYTSVDQPNDCLANSSSNLVDANGKVGCTLSNQAEAGPFGRFYPSHFAYFSGSLAQPQDGFSYFGRLGDFSLSYTLEARSLGNPSVNDSVLTKRYAATTPVLVAANGTTPTDLLASGALGWSGGSGAWTSGSYSYSSGTSFIRSNTAPAGPYSAVYFGVGISGEPDAVSLQTSDKDFKLGDPACTSGCTHKKINAAAAKVFYGRMRMQSACGSVSPLQVPVEAQYWTGSGWAKNADDLDSFTSAGVTVAFDSAGWPAPLLKKIQLENRWFFEISPASRGIKVLTAAVPDWLKANWGGAAQYDQNPSAQVAYGIACGNSKNLHVRERY